MTTTESLTVTKITDGAHLRPSQIVGYHDETIRDDAVRRQIERHLAECPRCRDLLGGVELIHATQDQLMEYHDGVLSNDKMRARIERHLREKNCPMCNGWLMALDQALEEAASMRAETILPKERAFPLSSLLSHLSQWILPPVKVSPALVAAGSTQDMFELSDDEFCGLPPVSMKVATADIQDGKVQRIVLAIIPEDPDTWPPGLEVVVELEGGSEVCAAFDENYEADVDLKTMSGDSAGVAKDEIKGISLRFKE